MHGLSRSQNVLPMPAVKLKPGWHGFRHRQAASGHTCGGRGQQQLRKTAASRLLVHEVSRAPHQVHLWQELDGGSVEAESNFEILRAQRAQARKGVKQFKDGSEMFYAVSLLVAHFCQQPSRQLYANFDMACCINLDRTFARMRGWTRTTR